MANIDFLLHINNVKMQIQFRISVIALYSLVLKERHVSLVPHMTLIRPNTLPIKGAMTLFWIKPFYKCIVMPLFRIIPKFWDDFVYWKQPVCLDMSLFRINTLTKCRVMPLITPNTQPKCATITLFPHMPLFRHQRVQNNDLFLSNYIQWSTDLVDTDLVETPI